jgi:hypothetical protein
MASTIIPNPHRTAVRVTERGQAVLIGAVIVAAFILGLAWPDVDDARFQACTASALTSADVTAAVDECRSLTP